MKMIAFASMLGILISINVFPQSPSIDIKTYGVKINVTNMDKAIEFYEKKVGFVIESKKNYPNIVFLKNDAEEKLALHLVSNLVAESPKDIKAGISLQVNDYDSAVSRMKSNGVDFGNNIKRKEGVGYAISFSDPFGTGLSAMHVTVQKVERFAEPRIYNFGVTVSDMDKARDFFRKLGFLERSQKYLPLDMPLGNPDKSFGFMLHFREGTEALWYNSSNDEHVVIMFKTKNLESTIKAMQEAGIVFVHKKIQENSLGKFISFRDPMGMVYDLVEVKK